MGLQRYLDEIEGLLGLGEDLGFAVQKNDLLGTKAEQPGSLEKELSLKPRVGLVALRRRRGPTVGGTKENYFPRPGARAAPQPGGERPVLIDLLAVINTSRPRETLPLGPPTLPSLACTAP